MNKKYSTDSICPDVVSACAWCIGEYSDYLSNIPQIFSLLISPSWLSMPSRTQSALIWSALKIFVKHSQKLINPIYIPSAVKLIIHTPIIGSLFPKSFISTYLPNLIDEDKE